MPAPPLACLDRDGTIIEDTGFLKDPAAVHLLPGAAAAIQRLNALEIPVVIITNQSGLGRGLITPVEYQQVTTQMLELLSRNDAHVEMVLHCPHDPVAPISCDCRKPATGNHRLAADRLGRAPSPVWCIGDRLSDLAPARELRGRGVLVLTGQGLSHQAQARSEGWEVAADLPAAVQLLIEGLETE